MSALSRLQKLRLRNLASWCTHKDDHLYHISFSSISDERGHRYLCVMKTWANFIAAELSHKSAEQKKHGTQRQTDRQLVSKQAQVTLPHKFAKADTKYRHNSTSQTSDVNLGSSRCRGRISLPRGIPNGAYDRRQQDQLILTCADLRCILLCSNIWLLHNINFCTLYSKAHNSFYIEWLLVYSVKKQQSGILYHMKFELCQKRNRWRARSKEENSCATALRTRNASDDVLYPYGR